jgi:hypothetical protein
MIGLGIGVPLSRSLAGGSNTGSARLGAYRIVYDESLSGRPARWDILSVRRPFESADLVYTTTGPPSPSDRPTSGNVSTEDRLFDVDATGLHDVGGRQPGPPSGDLDLATQVPEMLHRGLARDAGSDRRVAGRSCHLYQFLEPPVGPVRPLGGPSEHDDLCIDADGLVLSEAWNLDGQVVMQRRATSVSLSAVAIPPVNAASPPAGNASLISPARDQQSFLAAPPPPPGYRTVSPVRFTLPDPANPSSLAAASVVWTFVKGADVVSVEAGNERPGQLPWQANDTITEPVKLTGLGPAQSAIRSDGAEIRVDLRGGSWVRVRGTIPTPALADYANGLRLAAPIGNS